MRRLFSLLQRGVVALEQIARSLEVVQAVIVEAIEEEQRRLSMKEEVDERQITLDFPGD
jgi:hypothetical protein